MEPAPPVARLALGVSGGAAPVDSDGPLPGEVESDPALVDRIVTALNSAWRNQGLATARALGEIVLTALFRGDADAFVRRRRGHASLRALAVREDLQMSYHAVWTALAVTVQLRALPAPVGEALSLEHHRALLPLKDADAKVRLAAQAAREGWTVDELDARAREARGAAEGPGGGEARGRPRKPPILSALERLVSAAGVAAGGVPEADDLLRFGIARARAVVDAAEEELDALAAALVELRERLAEAARLAREAGRDEG